VRGSGSPVTDVDGRLIGGWSVCPVGTGKGKHGALDGFSIGQGKIGGGEGERRWHDALEKRKEKGRGWESGLVTPHGEGGRGGGAHAGRQRRWSVGLLPHKAGEWREEGGGGSGVWATVGDSGLA
jgi:hypothetical protein